MSNEVKRSAQTLVTFLERQIDELKSDSLNITTETAKAEMLEGIYRRSERINYIKKEYGVE